MFLLLLHRRYQTLLRYLCFRVKDDIVLSDLAKWYFESSQWHRGVNEICAEGARNHGLLNVPTDGFFNTVHTLPSDPEEQLAIASYEFNRTTGYIIGFICWRDHSVFKALIYISVAQVKVLR